MTRNHRPHLAALAGLLLAGAAAGQRHLEGEPPARPDDATKRRVVGDAKAAEGKCRRLARRHLIVVRVTAERLANVAHHLGVVVLGWDEDLDHAPPRQIAHGAQCAPNGHVRTVDGQLDGRGTAWT